MGPHAAGGGAGRYGPWGGPAPVSLSSRAAAWPLPPAPPHTGRAGLAGAAQPELLGPCDDPLAFFSAQNVVEPHRRAQQPPRPRPGPWRLRRRRVRPAGGAAARFASIAGVLELPQAVLRGAAHGAGVAGAAQAEVAGGRRPCPAPDAPSPPAASPPPAAGRARLPTRPPRPQAPPRARRAARVARRRTRARGGRAQRRGSRAAARSAARPRRRRAPHRGWGSGALGVAGARDAP
jgi:hypothetical protein